MGVPRFYRFLSERYPLINQKLTTQIGASGNTAQANSFEGVLPHEPYSVDLITQIQQHSSSSFSVDCLYLDLNGVLHNSTHANSQGGRLGIKQSKDEIWIGIMNYIEGLVQIAKPSRLLFIGIDGVAPRAKMNQQRARRFRAAKDRSADKSRSEDFKSRVADSEVFNAPPLSISDLVEFDSNCITPGTAFMDDVCNHLFFYLTQRLTNGGLWANLEVILSGPDVPGEGEHKIMEFIRAMRSQPDYDPNLSHCIQGLDADLIMLALMSHEPKFILLREEVITDHEPRWLTAQRSLISNDQQFVLLHVSLIREYLFMDILSGIDSSVRPLIDPERLIDDFILVCCLSGNDFLPHLHFADISQGGMANLISLYKDHLAAWEHELDGPPPFLLERGGLINWSNFISFLERCAVHEEEELEEIVKDLRHISRKNVARPKRSAKKAPEGVAPIPADSGPAQSEAMTTAQDCEAEWDEAPDEPTLGDWLELGHRIRDLDDVTAFFYYRKMKIDALSPEGALSRDRLLTSYLEGLQWNMRYYFDGTPSWSWFFPFHYPPFVRDLLKFLRKNPEWRPQFHMGEPFRPFEQLMAVLPPSSAQLVPAPYRSLMLNPDSPLIHFYPRNYKIDREGTKVNWGGITLLPFIDEGELKRAMREVEKQMDVSLCEANRNERGSIHYFSAKSEGALFLKWLKKAGALEDVSPKAIEYVSSTLPSLLPLVSECKAFSHTFPPSFRFACIQKGLHSSALLEGVVKEGCHRSFFRSKDVQDSKEALFAHLGAHRIADFAFRARVASVFNRPTRGESFCVKIRPNWSGTDIGQVVKDWSRRIVLSMRSFRKFPGKHQFDFTSMFSVYHAYPYQTIGKVIGIWTSRGYVPLRKGATQVPCSLLDDSEIVTSKGDRRDDPLSDPRWKESGAEATGKLFHAAADRMYARVIKSGRYFSEEPDPVLTGLHEEIIELLGGQGPQGAEPQGVSWKDILIEVVDHEEVAESLAGKPLLRYRHSASKLLFLPELDLLPDEWLMNFVHEESLGGLQALQEGDVVLSNSKEHVGLVGKLISRRPYRAVFETYDSPEVRRHLQELITSAAEEHSHHRRLSLKSLARQLSVREDALRWLLRKVLIRTSDRAQGPIDIGLGLMSDVRHPLSGSPVPVSVPGFSTYVGNSYWFTEDVISLVEEVQVYLPCLFGALERALDSRAQLRLADLFTHRDASKRRKGEEDEYRLSVYTRWLVLQRCKTIGTTFGHAVTLPRKAVDQIVALLDDFRARRLGQLPMTVTISNARQLLPLLSSPVTPADVVRDIGLGQRVVVIKATSHVKPGSTGFVSGILPNLPLDMRNVEHCGDLLAEVVLDTPCIGGTDLNGQLSCPMRGLLIPLRHLLPLAPVVRDPTHYYTHEDADAGKRTDGCPPPPVKKRSSDSVPPPPPEFPPRRLPPPPPPYGGRSRGNRMPRGRRGGRGSKQENGY